MRATPPPPARAVTCAMLGRCRRSRRSSRSRRPVPCAGRSTTCARTASGRLGARRAVRPPRRDRRRRRRRRDLGAARRAARRAAPRARPRPAARARRARALDGGRVLLDAGPRARARLAAAGRAGEARAGGRAPHRRRRRSGARRPSASARCSRGCRARRGADLPALRRLEARGLVALERRADAPPRPTHESVGARRAQPPPLTADQTLALAEIETALQRSAAPQPLLLHGVTGSGKTEVYLRAAETALEQGRGVIVLVPEIALTPQIVGRFLDRFGDTVAVLHSKLAAGERHDEWTRLRGGERARLRRPALGGLRADRAARADRRRRGARRLLQARGRPALRRPPRRRAPRRAGRRAARRRQRDAAARERPRAAARAAAARVDGRPLPPVQIVDMREHARRAASRHEPRARRRARRRSCCSTAAAGRTSSTAARAATPGRARTATSRSSCTARRAQLACHHCGHRERVPQRCTRVRLGVGRAARRGHRAPRARARARSATRSFASTPTCADAGRAAARASSARRAGSCVGTQMVAKGHDFPDVTLGVVVDADGTLRFPDFRAEERTFALVAQLAGRAGRGAGGGRVLVQTLAPDAASIAAAARHDADGFLDGELARREALRYPPFSHLIRIVCSAPSRTRVRRRRARGPRARSARSRRDGARARRRCFACAGASARSSSSRARDRARRGARRGRRGRRRRGRARASRRRVLGRRRSAVGRSRLDAMADDVEHRQTSEEREAPPPLDPEVLRAPRRGAAPRAQARRSDPQDEGAPRSSASTTSCATRSRGWRRS